MHSFSTFGRKNDRYSAKNNLRSVSFMFVAPEAGSVSIMGDFNQWNPESHPLQRFPDGGWRLDVSLTHGHHQYLFVVDGQSTLDPRADGVGRNSKNERVSLVAVS